MRSLFGIASDILLEAYKAKSPAAGIGATAKNLIKKLLSQYKGVKLL